MAGYSGTPLPKKLGIVGDAVFVVVDAPEEFAATLGDFGDAVWQRSLLAPLDVVVAFFTSRTELVAAWPKLTEAVEPDGSVWVAWPKKTSGVATDITEDVLREELLPDRLGRQQGLRDRRHVERAALRAAQGAPPP